MSIDFTCQKCETSFELAAQDLIEGTEKLVCPNCDAKAPSNLLEDFVAALTEMRTQLTALSKRFGVSLPLESEELEDELDEESDEDDESDDEELDFDEDEDEESDDEDYDEDEKER